MNRKIEFILQIIIIYYFGLNETKMKLQSKFKNRPVIIYMTLTQVCPRLKTKTTQLLMGTIDNIMYRYLNNIH